jgi:serine/threonine protein kinase
MNIEKKLICDDNIYINDKSIKINDRLKFIKFLLNETDIKPLLDIGLCTDCTEYFHKDVNKNTYNFFDVITKIGGKLKYIKSGSTGHTFQGIYYPNDNKEVCIHYAVKVVAYPRENKKESENVIYNITRPENAELQILKVLSQFVITNQTPHIVLPLATFNSYIDPFISLKENKYINNKRYDMFINKYNKGELHNIVSILLSEWADGKDLLEYLRNNIEKVDLKEWRVMLFQILSVLTIIQRKYPGFRHNDLKANNILLQNIDEEDIEGKFFRYQIDNIVFYVPNIGYQIKIWDFDFACINGVVENSKVNSEWTKSINITNKPNRYYDICFFIISLQKPGFIHNFRENKYIPTQIIDFFDSIVPPELANSELINERGRLLCDLEYTTPLEILLKHPFFNKLRPKDNRIDEDCFKPSGRLLLNKILKKIIT